MINDLGFLIFSIENNRMFDEILLCIKKYIDNFPYKQVTIFNSVCEKIDTKNIPLLHIKQAKFFDGDIFVFDLIGLMLIKNFPNIKNKYYFASNIPWEQTDLTFTQWSEIFNQPNLNIIAHNKNIYNVFDITWKKPLGISETFNYESLSKIL